MRRKHPTCLALPSDVKWGDISFKPDWEELAWTRWRAAEQQIKLDAAQEQREWLQAQTQRLALIALELDEAARKIALQEEMDKQDSWWKATAEREKSANERLMAAFQKSLDAATYSKLLARVEKAGKEIEKSNARLERLALLRRGVVRGRRGELVETTSFNYNEAEFRTA